MGTNCEAMISFCNIIQESASISHVSVKPHLNSSRIFSGRNDSSMLMAKVACCSELQGSGTLDKNSVIFRMCFRPML